jgi:hypothetical protein
VIGVTGPLKKPSNGSGSFLAPGAMSEMAELDVIAEMLRRQKKDLREMKANTASRSGETADLMSKIEDLRRRSEETQRRFHAAVRESESKEKK